MTLKKIRKNDDCNHVINVVRMNDISYFLDCTNDMIFRVVNNSCLLSGDYIFKIKKEYLNINDKKYKEIKHIIDMSKRVISMDFKLREDTLKICKNNIDVFEKFYIENKDKYLEIHDKMKILKK